MDDVDAAPAKEAELAGEEDDLMLIEVTDDELDEVVDELELDVEVGVAWASEANIDVTSV